MTPYQEITDGGVTSPLGFSASAVAAAIKYEGRKDVAVLFADAPCAVAGVFTTNKVAAAPVLLDRQRVVSGQAQAVLINTGCANACTGQRGFDDAAASAKETAAALGIAEELVLVASTGVIGTLLPLDCLIAGAKAAAASLSRGDEETLARAIMTTDTVPKHAAVTCEIDGKKVTVGGMCKGAGMIEPMMATMLCFITTDAAADPAWLKQVLKKSMDASFNRIVVDGDESTNDTALIFAGGAAGNTILNADHPQAATFEAALLHLATTLAKKIVMDGEGVTKFVTVRVKGAASDRDAQRVARAIGKSPLVKTAWFGTDPNWGRVICATGYSGAEVDESKVRIFYGDVCAYDRGAVADDAALAKMKELMRARCFDVTVDLGLGSGEDTLYTCDFSLEYVKINADYTT